MKFLVGTLAALIASAAAFAPHTRLATPAKTSINRNTLVMRDYPKPNIEDTDNYRQYNALSKSFSTTLKASEGQKKKVAIIGENVKLHNLDRACICHPPIINDG